MAPSSSAGVPWRPAPWTRSRLCWPLAAAARGFEAEPEWPRVEAYRALLGGACPVEFRPAAPRPRGRRRALRRLDDRSYDAVICDERAVPTRARSWHDLFNALVWATFPRTKTALHARQLRAQAARSDALDGRRTREQDGLALLDEGGVALLCGEASLAAARAALDTRDADTVSELVGRGTTLGVVYGHAIYEQLACGGPAVRAMVHLVACPSVPIEASSCVALADVGLARALSDEASFTQPEALRSLPVTLDVLGSRP